MKSIGDQDPTEILRDRLVSAARTGVADERVPFGFEQRVMGQLAKELKPERWSELAQLWTRGLWRALIPAVSCLAIVAALQVHRRDLEVSIQVGLGATTEKEAVELVLLDVLDADLAEIDP